MQSNLAFAAPIGAAAEILETQWVEVQQTLQARIGADPYRRWFDEVILQGVVGTTIQLTVPNQAAKDRIMVHYIHLLLFSWHTVRPNVETVVIRVDGLVSPPLYPRMKPASDGIPIDHIQRVVCLDYGVSKLDLISERRTRVIMEPRQVAMYFAKTLTTLSLPHIGRRFGGRDHTTIIHGVQKIEGMIAADEAFAEKIESLRQKIVG